MTTPPANSAIGTSARLDPTEVIGPPGAGTYILLSIPIGGVAQPAFWSEVLSMAGGALAPSVVALTDGASIPVNAALGNDFRVTLGGNRTIANPTNPIDGQDITFLLTQDGSGSRIVTWGSAYSFGTSGAPTLTATGGKTDLVGFKYRAAASSWVCIGSALGF